MRSRRSGLSVLLALATALAPAAPATAAASLPPIDPRKQLVPVEINGGNPGDIGTPEGPLNVRGRNTVDYRQFLPSAVEKKLDEGGSNWAKDFFSDVPGKLKESYKGSLTAVPAGVATFYAAMAVTQVYLAYMRSDTNPTGLNDYGDMFNIPMAVSMGTFVVAGYPLLKDTAASTAAQGPWKGLPKFALGIGLAMTASQVIYMLAADPDVQKGLTKGDVAALDRAYNRWVSLDGGDYLLHMVGPQLVGILEGTAMYWALTRGILPMLSRVVMTQGMRELGKRLMLANTGGPVPRIMLGIGGTALFIGAAYGAEAAFGLQKSFGDWFSANVTVNPSELGTTLMGAESTFFDSWYKLRANGYQPPAPGSAVTMEGSLDNFSKKLFAYRKSQMSETFGIYSSWIRKVKTFNETRQVTYDFYKDVTDQIAAARQSAARNPLEFNSNWIKNASKQASIAYPDLSSNSGLAYSSLGNVSIYNVTDLVVAGMACGPEVESGNDGITLVDNRSFMRKAYDFVTMKPDEASSTVDNRTGHVTHFIPPKITEPKPVGQSVCEYSPSVLPVGNLYSTVDSYTVPPSAISDESRRSDLSFYSRLMLTEYIARDIRSTVVTADGKNQFDQWWKTFVEPQVLQAQSLLQKEYVDGVVGSFYNDLTRTDYSCFGTFGLTTFDARKYGNLLDGWDRPDLCTTQASSARYRPHGAFEGIRNEAHLYLRFLNEVATAAPNVNPLVKAQAGVPAQPILFKDETPDLTGVNPGDLRAGDVTITPQMMTKSEFLKRTDTLEKSLKSLLVMEKILKSSNDANSKDAAREVTQFYGQLYMLKKLLNVVKTSGDPVLEYKKKLAISAVSVMQDLGTEVETYYSIMNHSIIPELN